jgi:hypothetical protein
VKTGVRSVADNYWIHAAKIENNFEFRMFDFEFIVNGLQFEDARRSAGTLSGF